ncbi:PepSY domain-containing protein, partial [Microvirga sp. 3-52]|nr:PepSY domain-containing protein [Microvirga sp. 3-52]
KKVAVVKSDGKTTANNKNFITAKEAIAIALKHSPGTVKEVELDDDDKRAHFEIEIEDGKYEYEFEIDAMTGKILDFEKDRDDD